MSGFCSFLTRDPNTPVPALDKYLAEQSKSPDVSGEDRPDSLFSLPHREVKVKTTPGVISEADLPQLGADTKRTPVVMARAAAITTPVVIRSQIPAIQPQEPKIGGPEIPSAAQKEPLKENITTPVVTYKEQSITTPVFMLHQQVPGAPITTPVVMDEVETAVPLPRQAGRAYNIHRCVLAQDGHSRSEQVLYDILWRSAPPAHPGDAFRLATISMKNLGAVPAIQMTQKNLRIALQRLAEKLSIEEAMAFDPKAKTSRVWRVFSYKSILERRKAAGMEWIVRDKGVRFVHPEDPAITAPVVIPKTTGAVIATTTPVVMARQHETTPVITTQTTPVVLGSPSILGLNLRTSSTSSAVPVPTVIVDSVHREMGFVDDNALQRLIRDCRKHAPDATDEEIAELAGHQARRIVRMGRKVESPIGLLIDIVPRCFEGEAFARYRRENAEQLRRFEEATRHQRESET